IEEPHGEGDSDHYLSDESYFSHQSSDDDNGHDDEDDEISSDKENSKFQNVHDFRRALNHHVVVNEFEYFIEKSDLERVTARCVQEECPWRIHASLMSCKIKLLLK
ncbi:transposase, MuDR, MULE transposase domain protein, partial [Tanacetum coccineum]